MDKILCLGKNFPLHAEELGEKQPPFPVIFAKFPSVLFEVEPYTGQRVVLSSKPQEIHHELEVVLRISRSGSDIAEREALHFIDAVTVGLDLTDRPLQEVLKKKGHPWTLAKNFSNAAIVGPFVPINEFKDFQDESFSLEIDGALKQRAKLSEAFFGPAQAISYLSKHFELLEGDLVFMGTPTGVGPLKREQSVCLKYGPIDITFQTV